MALATVRAQIAGQWYDLIWNAETRRYEANLILSGSSYNEPGGYFNVTVEATNETGATVSVDGTVFPELRLVLRDADKPVLTLVSPTGPYVTSKTPEFILTATDGETGSGIVISSLSIKADGAAVTENIFTEETEDGYRITFTPPALSEGQHTITVSVADNDGNTGTLSHSFTVDTVPPWLEAHETTYRLIVDVDAVTIRGFTNDATSSPVNLTVTVNGTEASAEVRPDGGFSLEAPLEIGLNEITVTATDLAGLTSVVVVPVIRLITDRTESDVDRVRELLDREQANWTAEENEWFQRHILRGSYDYTDFNRVSLAMEYLRDHLNRHGYSAAYQPDGAWNPVDTGLRSRTERYVRSVSQFQDVIPLDEEERLLLPDNLENINLDTANGIELILVRVDAAMMLGRRNPWYFGEIYSGEV